MAFAKTLGQKHFEGLAENFVGSITKRSRRSLIEQLDEPLLIDADDRLGTGF